MTYAPTTNAPARNANVEAYINPDPNPNPNPNPYPALNQKPNHTHESNSVFGEVSMPEQLSPEHMSCHPPHPPPPPPHAWKIDCFQMPYLHAYGNERVNLIAPSLSTQLLLHNVIYMAIHTVMNGLTHHNKAHQKSCIGITRPTLKILPTLDFFFFYYCAIVIRNHKKSS